MLKRTGSTLVILLITIISVEAGLRLFFAYRVGPSVLLYGTPWQTKIVEEKSIAVEDSGWITRGRLAEGQKRSVSVHDNRLGNYSKYFPNQKRFDFDYETGERFVVHINNRGFRGENFKQAKAANVLRVLTLGASSTFGYFDRDDETYPSFLERRLNEDGCGRNQRFEVINFGIPHLRSENIVSLFMAEGAALEPDIVTFYEGVNDTRVQTGIVGEMQRLALPRRLLVAMRERLLALKFAHSLLVSPSKRFDVNEVNANIEGKAAHFLSNLQLLRAESEARGRTFIVATQQAKSGMVEREAMRGLTYADEVDLVRLRLAANDSIDSDAQSFLIHAEIMRDLRQWANTARVPLADVITAMDDRRDHLLSWVHLAPDGNRTVASVLAETILETACPFPPKP